VHARHEQALLVHVAVDHEVDQVGVDAGVVDQRGALGRRPVGGDRLALRLEVAQQGQEAVADAFDPGGEVLVVADVEHAQLLLLTQVPLHVVAGLVVLAEVPAEGAPVEVGEVLDVVEEQPVAAHQGVDGGAREVAEVLVVDRVELAVLDEVADAGVLDRDHARLLEQLAVTRHEAVEVGHVRHHVVGDDDVGLALLGRQLAGEVGAEELGEGRHAVGLGRRRLGGRGVDAEHGHAGLDEVLQQVAVVARHLDHEAVGPEALALDVGQGVGAGVPQQVVGERREIEVVVDEELLGRHFLGDLHQRTAGAERHLERERLVGTGRSVGRDQGVGQRRAAEVEEAGEPGLATGSTGDGGDHQASAPGAMSEGRRSSVSAPLARPALMCSMRWSLALVMSSRVSFTASKAALSCSAPLRTVHRGS
jgi:hypothetical protein